MIERGRGRAHKCGWERQRWQEHVFSATRGQSRGQETGRCASCLPTAMGGPSQGRRMCQRYAKPARSWRLGAESAWRLGGRLLGWSTWVGYLLTHPPSGGHTSHSSSRDEPVPRPWRVLALLRNHPTCTCLADLRIWVLLSISGCLSHTCLGIREATSTFHISPDQVTHLLED